ncbi:MAG: hypothetical protein C5S48_03185 [Candidatus Methanogaster sp.]|nr:MAG: hypothetical protein C5S48_03185 [ANME-2 cluster archaeon]
MPNVLLNFTITPPPTTYNSASIAPSINTTDESGYTTATARIDKRAGTRVMKRYIYSTLNRSHFCFILLPERKHLSYWIEPIATGFSYTVKESD